MKAAVYYETGGPEVFRWEEVSDPVCSPDGIVVDVEVVSLEGGDTLHRRNGPMSRRPHVVGYQCAGVVSEVGAQVEGRSRGQRVVCVGLDGSHAERRAVPAGASWVVPEGADLEKAACVPIPFGTADDCLFEFGRLAPGETVLVHAGAGGVGMAAIQLARRAGAKVITTASSRWKLDRLAKLGADHGIDYTRQDFVAAVRELTGGRGADLVVDSVGGRTLQGSIDCAAYRGRIVTVGEAGRDGFVANPASLRPGNKTLVGVFLGAELFFHQDRVRPMIQRHVDAVAAGELEVVIDRRFPLREAAAAHAFVESREAFGRVLLRP